MRRYMCAICGFVYDEEGLQWLPEGIAENTKWDEIPQD